LAFVSLTSFAFSALSTTARNSSTDFAASRSATNLLSMSSVESFERTSRCSLAAVSGAAMRNMSLVGLPSEDL
jgi:hypothetical protein